MITNLDQFQQEPSVEPVLRHFNDITDIPRPSKNEAAIRNHLVDWADSNGFETRVDAIGNVIINVPATEGLEGRPRIILQSHMDMVTFGDNVENPTQAHIEERDGENWLVSSGETTLGADNGIGVAMSMAIR